MNTNKRIDYKRLTGTVLLATGLVAPTLAMQHGRVEAQSGGFADQAFKRVWDRTDSLVAQSRVNRTWMWGPSPGRSLYEAFNEGSGGKHLVQYFDKARMEINYPSGNPNDPFYVTNGLLVVEMISGQVQKGVSDFEDIGANDTRIAGDDGSDAPSYTALQAVASVGLPGRDNRVPPLAVGSSLPSLSMSRFGDVDTIASGLVGSTFKVAAYAGETGHNIPDVFWRYMNSQGPVSENGAVKNGPLMNWASALGYPVTEAYWTNIRVQGRERLVLFQAFQRRILTYSPDNPEGWKVEMGNVGLQYYSWRYESGTYCTTVPVRGFGTVWAEHRNVQRGIGCPQLYGPYDKETAVQTSYQPFQHGMMLWVSPSGPTGPYLVNRPIYVFFEDGTFQQFEDTWHEGDPVNGGLTPPSGLYEPEKRFGKVWREGTGARVRERLGWATQPQEDGPGAYQRFERGEMLWTGTASKIFVLYGTVGSYPYPVPTPGGGSSPFRYGVYDDTYSP